MMQAEHSAARAPVNKIIPFSGVDGPGNRAAVFLQGCGYTCGYCHNPETIRLCSNCGDCIPVCRDGALVLQNGYVKWSEAACKGCDACIAVCRNFSSPKVRNMTAKSVMHELSEALPFITGITASGGECTLYATFLCELFVLARQAGKHTMVDTNGQRLFSEMPELLNIMDAAALDVKTTGAKEHLALTGAPVDTVLENLTLLAEAGKLFEVRTVIAPGRLENHRTVADVARLIARYPGVRYKLIRFRPYGVRGQWADAPVPDGALMRELAALANDNGAARIEIVGD